MTERGVELIDVDEPALQQDFAKTFLHVPPIGRACRRSSDGTIRRNRSPENSEQEELGLVALHPRTHRALADQAAVRSRAFHTDLCRAGARPEGSPPRSRSPEFRLTVVLARNHWFASPRPLRPQRRSIVPLLVRVRRGSCGPLCRAAAHRMHNTASVKPLLLHVERPRCSRIFVAPPSPR